MIPGRSRLEKSSRSIASDSNAVYVKMTWGEFSELSEYKLVWPTCQRLLGLNDENTAYWLYICGHIIPWPETSTTWSLWEMNVVDSQEPCGDGVTYGSAVSISTAASPPCLIRSYSRLQTGLLGPRTLDNRRPRPIYHMIIIDCPKITSKRRTWMDRCQPESLAIQADTCYNGLRACVSLAVAKSPLRHRVYTG